MIKVCKYLLVILVFAALTSSLCAATLLTLDDYIKYTPEQNLRLKEAPMLAKLVEAGKLPPLEQRLPDEPLVIPLVERSGYYGGVWRSFHLTMDMIPVRLITNYYGFTRWQPDVSNICPGIARSWQIEDGGKKTIFKLRKGIKWSDGFPFTSKDIIFWWQLCNDKRTMYVPPEWAYSNGQLMSVSAPDDYTVVFEYNQPFYFLPLIMATGFWVPEFLFMPAHYLKQFHPNYNSAYSDFNILVEKNKFLENPERPSLGPWHLVYISDTRDKVIYERNPYYYAVDPQGRQLPYIDRIESIRVQDAESGVLLAITGAIDIKFRDISIDDYTLLKHFEHKGGYKILKWQEGTAAWHAISINMSSIETDKRELFRNQDFRTALALGVNRDKINQIVWNGEARPQGAAITDESWHFDSERGQKILKEWITKWSEYDPNTANSLLDKVGLNKLDKNGFRLYKGKPLKIFLEFFDDPIAAKEAPLIKQDWEKLGLRIIIKPCFDADLYVRNVEGKYDLLMHHNSEIDLFTFPNFVFPVIPHSWHPQEGRWYSTGGKKGAPPTGFMKELIDIYEKCKTEPDLKKRHGYVLDAIQIQLDNGPFMIGTCGRQRTIVLLKDYVRNVPSDGILGPWAICQPASINAEQFYYDSSWLYRNNKAK
jgi:peptide/nickel transport system substrate-binding protein